LILINALIQLRVLKKDRHVAKSITFKKSDKKQSCLLIFALLSRDLNLGALEAKAGLLPTKWCITPLATF
jgi:hypothetical protein